MGAIMDFRLVSKSPAVGLLKETVFSNQVVALQVVAVMEGGARFQWLKERLPSLIDAGDVLIFAGKKVKVDELTAQLSAAGFRCDPQYCSTLHKVGTCI